MILGKNSYDIKKHGRMLSEICKNISDINIIQKELKERLYAKWWKESRERLYLKNNKKKK